MASEPGAAQKRMLAKMGLAMPDGSYYIRNGPVGAEDLQNAIKAVGRGEPQSSHNDIRRHIMKRAAALKLSKEIPDNWNPDGSLKQSAIDFGEAYLEHFGRKGMKWGSHVFGGGSNSPGGKDTAGDKQIDKALNKAVNKPGVSKGDKLLVKAKAHETIAANHAAVAQELAKQHEELLQKGVHSTAFKNAYGKDAPMMTDNAFYFRKGISKAQALGQADSNLRLVHNQYARSADRHAAKALKLHAKAEQVKHTGITWPTELDDMSDEAVLAHFGRKGMKWGAHVFGGGAEATPAHPDHQSVADIRATEKKHGTRVLSNDDLRTANERLNLEQNYHRLISEPGTISKGQQHVKAILGGAKTGLDAVETGKRVFDHGQSIHKLVKSAGG